MGSSTTTECDCRISIDFDILRRTDVFAGAPADVVRLFAYLARHRVYQAGESIITQGEKAESCYLIIRGEVNLLIRHRDQEIILQRVGAGGFIGELALLARFDWFFSARAVSETEVLVMSREGFHRILHKYPEKSDKMTEKVVHLCTGRYETQISGLLDRVLAADRDPADADHPLIR